MEIEGSGSDKPWQFDIHQCSYERFWTNEEERLLLEIGRRLAGGLSSFLDYRNHLASEQKPRTLNAELELRIIRRTAELEKKNKELENPNEVFVGRELTMLELKKKLKNLESPKEGENCQ